MTHLGITGRKSASPDVADGVDAYSITEFCRRNRISVQLFYKLKPQGLMPPTFRLGARVLISREAAQVWRRQREAANPPTVPAPDQQGAPP